MDGPANCVFFLGGGGGGGGECKLCGGFCKIGRFQV